MLIRDKDVCICMYMYMGEKAKYGKCEEGMQKSDK